MPAVVADGEAIRSGGASSSFSPSSDHFRGNPARNGVGFDAATVNGADSHYRKTGSSAGFYSELNGRLNDSTGEGSYTKSRQMNGGPEGLDAEQLSHLNLSDLNMTSSQLVDSCLRVLHDRGVEMAPYHGEPEVQEISSSYTVDVTYHPSTTTAAGGGTTNGDHHLGNVSPSQLHQQQQNAPPPHAELLSRTQKQHTTQQVTKVTKVIREVHHIPIGPDGQPLEPMPSSAAAAAAAAAAGYGPPIGGASPSSHPGYVGGAGDYPGYPVPPMDSYRTHSPVSDAGSRRNYEAYGQGYRDYEPYPRSPSYGNYADPRHFMDSRASGGAPGGGPGGGYPPDRPPTPPTPSERSESPPPHHHSPSDYGMRGAAGYPQSGYAELDATLVPPGAAAAGNHFRGPSGGLPDDRFDGSTLYGTRGYPGSVAESRNSNHPAPRAVFDEDDPLGHRSPSQASEHGKVRWRDPDLHEVIEFLNHHNNMVKANACAYLQHLCYMDNPVKQKTRALGGIPPLVQLLGHENPDVHRNACGALRNLSYGRQNDENKKAIMSAGGVPLLVRLLRKTPDNEVRELVAGTLWNLSSCEELKRPIIDDALAVLVNTIVIPCSGWDARGSVPPSAQPQYPDLYLSTVFRNATGVLRNVSSAGEYARKKLRECEGLIDSLLYIVKSAIGKSNIDNKSVENCVCILRNLSYRCQEVEDPNYDKVPPPTTGASSSSSGGQSRAGASKDENAGCFGGNKKKKDGFGGASGMQRDASGPINRQRNENVRGMELLWQPEVVQPYLSLLSDCSNPETLEAAAGAIQNLSACYWQPSLDVRAAVRKEKGLPILVELLRMEVDRVVCAVATALRNLAIDERNKELIGKYAMRDLVQKLPSGNPQQDHGTSDDTIAAVLATLNEVIKKNADFARSLYECGGVDRLVNITRQRQKYNARVIKFASQVLYTMWQHQDLREVYKSGKWKESDFVTRTIAAQKAAAAAANRPGSPNSMGAGGGAGANSTLNRPMASQGGTRYEDRTIQRQPQMANNAGNSSGYSMELRDMRHPDGGQMAYQHGGRLATSPMTVKPGEPLYAQVNREKKKNRQFEGAGGSSGAYGGAAHPMGGHPYDGASAGAAESIMLDGRAGPQEPAGDSWV